MAQLKDDSAHKSYEMGLHTEQLTGRSQQMYFSAEESDNFTYPQACEVDFDKTAEIDAAELEGQAVNLRIRSRDVAIALDPPGRTSILNVLPGTVVEIAPEEGPQAPQAHVGRIGGLPSLVLIHQKLVAMGLQLQAIQTVFQNGLLTRVLH